MFFTFSKYEGTGNDFILVADQERTFPLRDVDIPKLCHRQYGIGADGLILVQPSTSADFLMRIFNPNGQEAEMCGNGLRCLVDFLHRSGIKKNPIEIETLKKTYSCLWGPEGIRVGMGVPQIEKKAKNVFLVQVGVPHLVLFVEDLTIFDREAKKRFSDTGVNINYAKLEGDGLLSMRTFERGVEAETLSCGTGATAVCFSAIRHFGLKGPLEVKFQSGERLQFDLLMADEILKEIHMIGKVRHVFDGKIEI
ncbi:MAG: diaminopimelate epimerase [Chlamydiia bacterium]|nr:diaminopimelate epimerase [Chlamydiia bacterium]